MALVSLPLIGAASALLRRLASDMMAERVRWALWLPVMFGAGIAAYFGLPFEPSREAGMLAGAAGAAALAASIVSRRLGLRAVLAALAAVTLGFAVAKFREERVAAPVISQALGPVTVDARVEYAQPHGKGTRVLLSHLGGSAFTDGTPHLVRVSFRSGAEALEPGDRIRAMVVLMPPPGPAEPGDYDFARAAFFLGIGGVGYAYGWPERLASASPLADDAPGALIRKLRFSMTRRIHEVLPGSVGSIASALITGDRGGISETDEQALRDAGLAHVLAIAGLHMALVGLGIFWIVRALLAAIPALALRYPIKKWAAVAALLGSGFYLIISGAGPPSLRAFTMLAMMLLAILFDRASFSMRSIALAATLILIVEPESLVEPGFQMSFAAVAGLIAVAEWEQARRAAREREGRRLFPELRRYIRGIATTSLVGSFATLPFAIFHFDRATHFAVLGNLLAMPIMGFVTMPAAAFSVALMPLGLEALPLRVMGLGIQAMLAVGHFVSSLPGAVSTAAAWPIGALVLISLGGLWCVIWQRRWRWLGLIGIVAGIALAYGERSPDVLIGRDGRTAAVRTESGLLAFAGQPRDGYTASEWLKRDGDARDPRAAIGTPEEGIRCDGSGCVASMPEGDLIAFPSRFEALEEDCSRADFVVGSVQPCAGRRRALRATQIARGGGYAIWLSPFRMESVRDARGDRPWSQAQDAAVAEPFNSAGSIPQGDPGP